MDATSLSRIEGTARTAMRDHIDPQESRLWDRARFNLMLLYGGRRAGSNNAPGNPEAAGAAPFGVVGLDL